MAKKSRPAATGAPATNGSSRFKSSVLLGAMLFAPAAFLVLRGNLSVNEALVRFGCALAFAMIGTAVVISSLPAEDRGPSAEDQAQRMADAPAPVTESTTSMGVPVTQPVG
ncbi:hypothetical protein [Phycicoccus sp. Root101]|uniref:hypothetical protein n=1 Tax=Phycicoccus sp. Root101 TaxID=1736421 RepID=UPI0007039B47|nr:hypothetical protein [Phycicoccus sp. Root101]KQU65289.1 hypothetical protein ASC58_17480 [Phycicoccus sp. Root101]